MGCVTPQGPTKSTILKQQQIERIKKQLQKKNNQIEVLEQKNIELKIQRQQKLQEITQQIRQDEIQIIQFEEEDGQCDVQNGNSPQLGVASLLKCTICEEDYDMAQKVPWMVCSNQHTYCSTCINGMLKRGQNNCPECRATITAGNKNTHICLLIQSTLGLRQPQKKLPSEAIKLTISINKNNRYLSQYSITQGSNTLMKIGENNWYGLLCKQIISAEGTFKFCVQVVYSLHNNIEIGIIDLASKVQKNKMSNKRITYHLHDGRVMDSGKVQKPLTMWNAKGKMTPKGVNAKVIVVCDMDNNRIEWNVNGEVLAVGVITDFLKYSKAVPYISMFHAQDIVILNSW